MIYGVTIPRGEMTLGVIGSANRDETVFGQAKRIADHTLVKQTPFIRTRYSLLFGCAIGADGSTDRFHHSIAAIARLAAEKSFSFLALETQHILERTSFVTREVLRLTFTIPRLLSDSTKKRFSV